MNLQQEEAWVVNNNHVECILSSIPVLKSLFSTSTEFSKTRIPRRFNFNSEYFIPNALSRARVGEQVVITHRAKGEFSITRKVLKVTLYFMHLRLGLGMVIQKH